MIGSRLISTAGTAAMTTDTAGSTSRESTLLAVRGPLLLTQFSKVEQEQYGSRSTWMTITVYHGDHLNSPVIAT